MPSLGAPAAKKAAPVSEKFVSIEEQLNSKPGMLKRQKTKTKQTTKFSDSDDSDDDKPVAKSKPMAAPPRLPSIAASKPAPAKLPVISTPAPVTTVPATEAKKDDLEVPDFLKGAFDGGSVAKAPSIVGKD